MSDPEIIIIGAGAAGLMAARELSKAGKQVLIVEARDRIGGRIMPLDEAEFGYPAQGGAEFVHGEGLVTKELIKEADLTFILEDGEIWSTRNGELALYQSFLPNSESLQEKLSLLKEDISIAEFLDKEFGSEEYASLRNSVKRMVEGYDAADPKRISTFVVRDEWLGSNDLQSGRIKEGYGALLDFLKMECEKHGVDIRLNSIVDNIALQTSGVLVHVANGDAYKAKKVIVTVPLPILKDIKFDPEISQKIKAADKIGFGGAIKAVIRFKSRWWENAQGKDMAKMAYLLSNEKFMTWWTQYPEINSTLVGWMTGPRAEEYKKTSGEDLFKLAIESLSNILKISVDDIQKEVINYKIVNWPADKFAKGAYSYTAFDTGEAYEELGEPIDKAIFFAGEALYSGVATSTVEGALGSGKEVAEEILKKIAKIF